MPNDHLLNLMLDHPWSLECHTNSMQGLEARLRSLAAFLSSSYRKGAKARMAASPAASQVTGGAFGSMMGDGAESRGGVPPAKRQRMEHVYRLEDQQYASCTFFSSSVDDIEEQQYASCTFSSFVVHTLWARVPAGDELLDCWQPLTVRGEWWPCLVILCDYIILYYIILSDPCMMSQAGRAQGTAPGLPQAQHLRADTKFQLQQEYDKSRVLCSRGAG